MLISDEDGGGQAKHLSGTDCSVHWMSLEIFVVLLSRSV